MENINSKKVILFISIILLSNTANADCVCSCVNGQNIPICSNSIDVRPVCPPKICPIVPPSIEPINPPRIPPIGTSQCTQHQVYNDYTGIYEWKQLCY